MSNPDRIPVIVAIGQINDRPDDPAEALDSLGLMAAALRLADDDGGGGWLTDLDALSTVDQISCPELTDIAAALAARLGATPRIVETTEMPHGDSPIRLLNLAANRIGRGEIRSMAVVGAEVLRSVAKRAAASGTRPGDLLRANPKRRVHPYRRAFGLLAPTDMYPLYENASRHAWGQSLAEGQAETGAIWAQMAAVAAANPNAWLRNGASATDIVTPSASNRPIAHPYTKLMVANASVNQGAGFIVASLAEARRRGLPEDRLIHIGHGAGANEPYELLERADFTGSVSMQTVLTRTLSANRISAAELAHIELYSCFPIVPKLARRSLDWPLERPVTVFGGLTFGGAPVANYMSHAVASMVELLRGTSDSGLLYANGGIVTTNHAIVLSGAPLAARFPQEDQAQALADAARGPVPALAEDHVGPVTVESWTVFYDRDAQPSRGIVVARTAEGSRTLAEVPASDTSLIAALTDGSIDPVGQSGRIAIDNGRRRFAF
ncbi:hypothetical protein [Pseudooceanicola sp.]|uniref:hypothetical protein n=1 Tax=Pseudooceanicola sp. TaxID=1914328 RepID=UPI00262E55B4|nr:hypothetical protein [Pseudooceanicola sp.]MDF1855832.1 hypothetical protein [Pseudooceanicola sp.]